MNSLQNLLDLAAAAPAQTGVLVLGSCAAITVLLTAIFKAAASRGAAFDAAVEVAFSQRQQCGLSASVVEPGISELEQSSEISDLTRSTELGDLARSAELGGLDRSAELGGLDRSAELGGLTRSAEFIGA